MSNTPINPHARKNWGNDDSQTPILHLDMDSFFAQVELLIHPEYQGRPLIVSGAGLRGVVTSATYEARARGVRAGMPTAHARALAPDAVLSCSPHRVYKEFSRQVMSVIAQHTPVYEQLSIDEVFIDVSGARRRLGSPTRIAQMLREEIRTHTGLPASVGIASIKSVAKIASAHAKPDGLLLIPAQSTIEFLHSLPVGSLWGVGTVTQKILSKEGIDTVEQLAHAPMPRLTRLLGAAQAHHIHDLAWGIDPRKVGMRPKEKSVSTERTFERDITDADYLHRFILKASHECAARLRASDMVAWTIGIKIRDTSRTTITRSITLPSPTDLGADIAQAAEELLNKVGIPPMGVRLMGIKAEGLHDRAGGVPIALDHDKRKDATERAMDAVRQRFGREALRPAALYDPPETADAAAPV